MKGKVQTVLGLVYPDSLGCVLTHEHLLHQQGEVFYTPGPLSIPSECFENYTLENFGAIQHYPYSSKKNIEFSEDIVTNAVSEEMKYAKSVGVGTIVENSSIGLRAKNHSHFLKRLSQESSINIIAGTGYYVARSQTSSTLALSTESIEANMMQDITMGIDDSEIKCGVIGEIGCSWPIHPFERNVLTSAASVQEQLSCPVIIHPGRNKNAPDEIMRIFVEAGGNASKTVMSHLDRTLLSQTDLADFASSGGCFCEFDLFGIEVSHYQLDEKVDMPSDAQRIKLIHYLIEQGFEDRIVISHDIHTRHRLKKFGGHGYSHINVNIVPKMLNRGISADAINKILIHNPKNWLMF